MYALFNMSAKSDFVVFQRFTDTDIHRMLLPGQMRWLSLKLCVDRILEQWIPLQLYSQELALEDPTHANDWAAQALANPLLRIQLEFESYVLELFNDFNKIF